MKTDIEIAQSVDLQPIADVVKKVGIDYDDLELYGKYKAKLSFNKIQELQKNPVGKLILVTAINPTPAGEGKSTITIGLADALNKIGKKTMIAIREPSLGPVMGIKGGAAVMHRFYQWKTSICISREICMRLPLPTMPFLL